MGSDAIAKILIVDDEKDVLKAIKDTLVDENFEALTAATGKQGIKMAIEKKPDLILLDLRLPDIDGYDVCRQLKSHPKTKAIPVIIISTRSKDTEKVVGLEIGADDYLTKPYNELELLARIRVALRRRVAEVPNSETAREGIFTHGVLTLDGEARKVTVKDLPVVLTRKEFDLLAFLISRKGKALSRTVLLESVWGQAFDSLQGTVDSHVKTLRKKLGEASRYIETVPGIGYRWAEDD